jgi:sec-independent protein translocase protein TatA
MELALLLGLALLVFGPSRLPGLGKSLGDAIRGFKKGMDGEEEEPKAKPSDQITGSDSNVKDPQHSKDKNKV